MTSQSPRGVCRQSSRQRIAPLKWWVNERILLCPLSGAAKVVSSHSSDMPDNADENEKLPCQSQRRMVVEHPAVISVRSDSVKDTYDSGSELNEAIIQSSGGEVQPRINTGCAVMKQLNGRRRNRLMKGQKNTTGDSRGTVSDTECCLLRLNNSSAAKHEKNSRKCNKPASKTVLWHLSTNFELDTLLTPLAGDRVHSYAGPHFPVDSTASPDRIDLTPKVAAEIIRSRDVEADVLENTLIESEEVCKPCSLIPIQFFSGNMGLLNDSTAEDDIFMRSFWDKGSDHSDEDFDNFSLSFSSCDKTAFSGDIVGSRSSTELKGAVTTLKSEAGNHKIAKSSKTTKRNQRTVKKVATVTMQKNSNKLNCKSNSNGQKTSSKNQKGGTAYVCRALRSSTMTLRPRKNIDYAGYSCRGRQDNQRTKVSTNTGKEMGQTSVTKQKPKTRSKRPSLKLYTKVMPVSDSSKTGRKRSCSSSEKVTDSVKPLERQANTPPVLGVTAPHVVRKQPQKMSKKSTPNMHPVKPCAKKMISSASKSVRCQSSTRTSTNFKPRVLVTPLTEHRICSYVRRRSAVKVDLRKQSSKQKRPQSSQKRSCTDTSSKPPVKKQKLSEKVMGFDKPRKQQANMPSAATIVASKQPKKTRTAKNRSVKQLMSKRVTAKPKANTRKTSSVQLSQDREITSIAVTESSKTKSVEGAVSSNKAKKTRALKELNDQQPAVSRKKQNATQAKAKAGTVAKSAVVKPSVAKKSSTVPQVTTMAQVTGNRGTLKRRIQLRQLIEYNQQVSCSDADLFTSTPYRSNSNKLATCTQDMNKLEQCKELMESALDTLTVSTCVTPHAFDLCGRPNMTQTPDPLLTGDTPIMRSVNRKDADIYVHRLLKEKKAFASKRARKNIVNTESFSANVRKPWTPVPSDLLKMQPLSSNNDDDESEMDDYFDDV